jgi:predicted nuclease of predicted toxin-antitoxin system
VRFLVDANLPRSASELIARLGHDVEFARDIGLAAATDIVIASHARSAGAALVTRDLDFADVRAYPPQHYAGILVLRVPDHSVAAEMVDILGRFLSESLFVAALAGRLAIVEPDRVRFRPALE